MLKTGIIALALGVLATGSAANAYSVSSTSSYIGDVCDDFDSDGGASGVDFNDCNQILQGNGNPLGVYSIDLTGLTAFASTSAVFTISSTVFDLFLVGGGNNPNENFGLSLDNYYLGRLFDTSTADEASINAGLAASVQSNIDAATRSDGAVSLSFSVDLADLQPLVSDKQITAVFDFRGDRGVNSFRNLEISVAYAAVPVPASGLLFLSALGVVALRRRKRT